MSTADIPLSAITESSTNPRTHFNPTTLQELAESIRKHGVLQPILVRPLAGHEDAFELVAGHRRYRAATMAELSTIPAIVRDLDDQQTLEVQCIENLQREGLHPMEEAEGYERLVTVYGYSTELLAEKIGKSRSYVYSRMKLTALCKAARKALWDGLISHSVALLIARIPQEKVQAEAVKRLSSESRGDGQDGMSYRRATEIIAHEFMLRLSVAQWKMDDATLVPAAGGCSACPHRTGNQLELLGSSPSKEDLCTNSACFESKCEAFWLRSKAEAEASGLRVLTDAECGDLFSGGYLRGNSAYVEADSKCYEDHPQNRTYFKLVGKVLKPIIARNPRTGEVVKLYERSALKAALREAGHTFKGGNDHARRQREEAAARKIDRKAELAIMDQLMPRLSELPLTASTLRLAVIPIALRHQYKLEPYWKRNAIQIEEIEDPDSAIAEHITTLNSGQMLALVFEALLTFSPSEIKSEVETELPGALCELVGVDWKAIDRGVREEAERKEAAKAKKAAPKPEATAAAKAPVSKQAAKKAKLSKSAIEQNQYLSLIRQVPAGERNKFQKLAKEEGREAAITALLAATAPASPAATA